MIIFNLVKVPVDLINDESVRTERFTDLEKLLLFMAV